MTKKQSATSIIKDIKRKTRRKFSSEEKIRIVLEVFKAEESISTICRREGITPAHYYRWSKDFLEAGKKRLQGDTLRGANANEVNKLRRENNELKQVTAELNLEVWRLKKSFNTDQ